MDNFKLEKFISLLNYLFELLKSNIKNNKVIEYYSKNIKKYINYDDISILVVNINNFKNINKDTSIFKILIENSEEIFKFSNKIFIQILEKTEEIESESLRLDDNKIYYKNDLLEDITYHKKKEEIKLLFINLPINKDLNVKKSVLPIYLVYKYNVYSDFGKFKKLIKKIDKIINDIYINTIGHFRNLELTVQEIRYIDIKIIGLAKIIVENFENDLKREINKEDERIYKLIKKRYYEIVISYETVINILDYMKSKEPFEDKFKNLYDEILFKL